jgi:hypothetical protein
MKNDLMYTNLVKYLHSTIGRKTPGIVVWVLGMFFALSGWNPAYGQTYHVNGNAVNHGGGLVRLTSSSVGSWQTSSAWSTTKHDLTQPFDMSFDMFFGCENGPNGGDGITFTFQNQGINAIGAGGGYLGIGGGSPVTPAISIEFDTYDGTSAGGTNEIPQDHIAIDINGDVNNTNRYFVGSGGTLVTVQPVAGGRDLEDCAANSNNYYSIRVVWDPVARELRLYEGGTLTMTYANDLVNTVFGGNPSVYWGFTASTGAASNEQWIAPAGTIIPWSCAVNSCCTPFTVTTTGPTVVCNSPITLEVQGTYSEYQWSTGDNTSSISISQAGTYRVDVLQQQGGSMCPGSAQIVVGTTGPTATLSGGATICNDGSTSPLSVAFTGTPPWQLIYAIDGVAQTAITGITSSPYTIAGTAPHTYTLLDVEDNGGCNGLVSGTAVVEAHPGLPVGHDDTFVAPGTASLSVDNGGGVYEWYDAPSGGNLVHTGTLYNTPVLNATTTYYVENASIPSYSSKSVAILNHAAGNGPNPNDVNNGGLPREDLWLNFTANSNFTFEQLTCAINVILPWSNSVLSVRIQDFTGGTSYTKDSLFTTPLAGGMQTVTMPINYPIIAGHSYRISYQGQTTGGGLGGSIRGVMYWQFLQASSFPINTHPELSITTGTPGTRYPGLFDWRISVGSIAASCGRTPVTAYEETPSPVRLVRFTAKPAGANSAVLNWVTASEQNNAYFVVQRSSDGINFTDIGVVPGHGNSNSLKTYTYTDHNALQGVGYYRLKQTDFDGSYAYSNIARVDLDQHNASFVLAPNLRKADSEVRVWITGIDPEQQVTVSVYDVLGRKVHTVVMVSDGAGNVDEALEFTGVHLSSGTYLVVAVPQGQKEMHQKLINLD